MLAARELEKGVTDVPCQSYSDRLAVLEDFAAGVLQTSAAEPVRAHVEG